MQQRRVFRKDNFIPGDLVKINYSRLRSRHAERERENIPPTALATFVFSKFIRNTGPSDKKSKARPPDYGLKRSRLNSESLSLCLYERGLCDTRESLALSQGE